MENRERKIFIYALLISLLVHLLGLLLLKQSNLFSFTPLSPDDQNEIAQPLVLEFEQPPAQEQPQPEQLAEPEKQPDLPQKYFRVEDNPNANEQTPEQSDILSSKSSVAAAPENNPSNNRNVIARKDEPEISKNESVNEQESSPQKQEEAIDLKELSGQEAIYSKKVFSKDLLSSKPQKDKNDAETESEPGELPKIPEDFSADLVGKLALSTYEWKWAPWVMSLKQKFYHFLFVPTAYSEGLIEGYTEIWMKVNRQGELVDFKLLRYVGHSTLMESTVHAFKASAPYKELPSDFPDEFLELQVRVIYPNIKELYEKLRTSNQ